MQLSFPYLKDKSSLYIYTGEARYIPESNYTALFASPKGTTNTLYKYRRKRRRVFARYIARRGSHVHKLGDRNSECCHREIAAADHKSITSAVCNAALVRARAHSLARVYYICVTLLLQ